MARSRVVPALFVLLCNLQCATSTTTTVTATADSTLRESSPSSTGNWGNVEAYGSPNSPKVGIFKFDLTGFLGTTVSQATLQLYADELSSGGGDFAAYRTSGTDSWAEDSVTWSNGPSRSSKITTVTIASVNQWYSFDLTSYVAARVSASDALVTVWIEADSLNYQRVKFDSIRSDQPNKPKMDITTGSVASHWPSLPPSQSLPPLPPLQPPPSRPQPHTPPPPLRPASLGSPSYPPVAGSQFFLDWENGFPDGTPHLSPRGLEPSFSFNGNSGVSSCSDSTSDSRRRCKCGENGYSPYRCEINFGMSDLHYHEMLTVPWARKGNGVLKFYADGRNAFGQGSGDSSFRSELGAPQDEFIFVPGDEVYYSASFWPPGEYWDNPTMYSITITQFKMHSNPHGELRLSNRGDYKLYYRNSEGLWDEKAPTDDGAPLGVARRNAWNDVKIYYKKSLGSDGRLRVYLNGARVFEHEGATLHGTGSYSRGYVKFGLYTEIRDERVIYFDAVSYSTFLPPGYNGEAAWVASTLNLPTVSLTAPSSGFHGVSGEALSLSATASDPGGAKLGVGGQITNVEWLAKPNCVIGEDATTPYALSWTPPRDGTYELYVRATDADGNVVESSPVTVHSGSRLPTVTLTSPSSGANVAATGATTLQATAASADGSVSEVAFFVLEDGASVATSLGTATSVSGDEYSLDWTPPTAGRSYTLYAVATNNAGQTATSVYVGITVGATEGSVTLAPTDDASLKAKTSDRNSNNDYGSVEIYARQPDPDDGPQSIYGIWKVDAHAALANQAAVRDAKLRLWVNSGTLRPTSGANFSVWSTLGASSWQEGTVTWNNGPRSDEKLSVTRVTSDGQYYDFDVTSYLDAKVKEGVALSSITFWVQGDEPELGAFNSESRRSSNANPPQLHITYSDVALNTAAPPASDHDACSIFALPTRPPSPPSAPAPPRSPPQAPMPASPPDGCEPASESITTVTSVQDASISSGSTSATGQYSTVEVYGNHADGGIVGLFKFALPEDALHVTSAVLRLYVSVIHNGGGDFAVHGASGNDGWEESTVTWSAAPSKGDLITTVSITAASQWYDIDVTSYVAARASASASVATIWIEASALEGYKKFECHSQSRENPPTLTVTISSGGCGETLPPVSPPSSVPLSPSPPPPLQPPPSRPPPLQAPSPTACPGSSVPADVIFARYFDVAAGSAPGTFVSGRLNPYAPSTPPPPPSPPFMMTPVYADSTLYCLYHIAGGPTKTGAQSR